MLRFRLSFDCFVYGHNRYLFQKSEVFYLANNNFIPLQKSKESTHHVLIIKIVVSIPV